MENKRLLLIIFILIDIPILFGIFIWAFVYPTVQITGQSMSPTLPDKAIYSTRIPWNIARGDIVVYKQGEYQFVGRVVGMPNETIQITDSNVFINNQRINESYILNSEANSNYPKTTIPNDSYFIMGDNRPNSLDSRSKEVGFVDFEKVKRKLGSCLFNCTIPSAKSYFAI
jgi:signal peptidase I